MDTVQRRTGVSYPLLLATVSLGGVLAHPNVSAAVILGLGCEVNQIDHYLGSEAARSGRLAGITLQESGGNVLTFEVSLASRNTQSRLTVEKGQRIVHQVTGEKDGAAYFLTVHAS